VLPIFGRLNAKAGADREVIDLNQRRAAARRKGTPLHEPEDEIEW
jgi:hypothetical protein